jgi:hypothetical protein
MQLLFQCAAVTRDFSTAGTSGSSIPVLYEAVTVTAVSVLVFKYDTRL